MDVPFKAKIPFRVERQKNFSVLRDDFIRGGTKRRALETLLPTIAKSDIVYTGTVFGHGALAVAAACETAGKKAHLFISSNQPSHPQIGRIRETGAILHEIQPLPVDHLYAQACDFASGRNAYIFPPGFKCAEFRDHMVAALRTFDVSPYSEIWCSSVSGTLSGCLREAFPQTPVIAVGMAKSSPADFHAPEKYHAGAVQAPPYPACPYTDAKVWQFALRHAKRDALIWNTAG